MLQARYALQTPVLERGRTLAGYAAAAAATRLKRCVFDADAANACYLAADLLASGAGERLALALVDLVSDARFIVPAFALGVAADVADLADLVAGAVAVANDVSARHLAVQAVVRLCLLAKEGRNPSPAALARATALTRASSAKLSTLQAEAVPLLRAGGAGAGAGAHGQGGGPPDLMARVASALHLLRTEDGEAKRLRLVSLVARSASSAVPALAALATSTGVMQAPHARVALDLMAVSRARAPALLLAAFAGPAPLEAPPWTRAERANVMYAVLRTHLLFESLMADHEEATNAVLDKARAAATPVDPELARGIDATFRRKARMDALFRV